MEFIFGNQKLLLMLYVMNVQAYHVPNHQHMLANLSSVPMINGSSQLEEKKRSTNKSDCHDIAEILLKVALNTINLNQFEISKRYYPLQLELEYMTCLSVGFM
jgi:hypothetical protein